MGRIIPYIIGKIKNVPTHQPVICGKPSPHAKQSGSHRWLMLMGSTQRTTENERPNKGDPKMVNLSLKYGNP